MTRSGRLFGGHSSEKDRGLSVQQRPEAHDEHRRAQCNRNEGSLCLAGQLVVWHCAPRCVAQVNLTKIKLFPGGTILMFRRRPRVGRGRARNPGTRSAHAAAEHPLGHCDEVWVQSGARAAARRPTNNAISSSESCGRKRRASPSAATASSVLPRPTVMTARTTRAT